MEKRKEPANSDKPMAAPRAEHQRVWARLEAMGLDSEGSVRKGTGISHATYFRFKKGDASVATVRDIDEWAAREESKRHIPSAGTQSQVDAQLAEWMELGEKLLKADPARFSSTIDGIRDLLEAKKLEQRAFSKMFRATPDPER